LTLRTRLKKLIPEAVVTVMVEDVAGNRIYVIGQVNKPGMFIMNPQLNVLQALSLAGRLNALSPSSTTSASCEARVHRRNRCRSVRPGG
jgi:protein involved in polysaccharide export with SLBB domain